MAHFSFGGNNLRGFLNLGGYGGYWISSRIRGANIDIFSPGANIDDLIVHNRGTEWKDLQTLQSITSLPPATENRVRLGSLVKTDQGLYFLSVGTGKVTCEE